MSDEPALPEAQAEASRAAIRRADATATRGPQDDYRELLRSRRWDAAPLRNPEVEKTDPRIAVAFIVGLCVLTFVVLLLGYGSGFWSLPG